MRNALFIPAIVLAVSCVLPATARRARAAESPDVEPPRRALRAGPRLEIDHASHDFGRIAQGKRVSWRFTLSNTGDEDLEIKEVAPSCGCTTAEGWPHRLAPGESGAIAVNLETLNFSGEIEKTVNVLSNDPTHPEMVLELHGTVWTPIQVADPFLIFPAAVRPGEKATRSTTIRSDTQEKMTISDLHSEDSRFVAKLEETVPGKEYRLSVTIVPPFSEGTHSSKITMRSSSPEMPEISVTAIITILPVIQVAPMQIALMARKLDAPEKRYAVVLSNRPTNLEVSNIATNAPGVKLETTATPDGKQVTITLSFPAGLEIRPTDHFFLRGKTNQPDVPSFEIPIVFAGAE